MKRKRTHNPLSLPLILRGRNRVVTRSEKETMRIAERFAKTLRGGEIILLEGDLGSGKTTFVRGMARAFGIREPIRSPTFTLMHVHSVIIARRLQGRRSNRARLLRFARNDIEHFVHVDAYRLRGAKDLRALGLEEYIGRKDTIVAVEWGKKARKSFVGLPTRLIKFAHGKSINERKLNFLISGGS